MAKRAFITWGGWNGHEPEQTANICAGFLRDEGYTVQVSDSLDLLADSDFLDQQDLIVPVWTMSTIGHEQERGTAKCRTERQRVCRLARRNG